MIFENKKKLWLPIKGMVFIIALFFVVYYVTESKQSILSALHSISTDSLIFILLVYLVYLFCSACSLFVSSSQFQNFKHSFSGLSFVNSLSSVMGFLLPSGASPTKLILLNHFFKLEKVTSAIVIARVTNIFLLVSSLLALSICLIIYNSPAVAKINIELLRTILFCSVVCILFTAGMTYRIIVKKNQIKPNTHKKNLVNSFQFEGLKQISQLTVLSLVQSFLFALVLWIYLSDLNQNLPIIYCLLLISINNLTMILPLTPGNIGIREGIYYYVAPQIGASSETLVAISLIDRVVQLTFFIISSLLFYVISFKQREKSS